MDFPRDTPHVRSSAVDSTGRALENATIAADDLARFTATDRTIMLAQVGALLAHEVNNLLSPALARCDILRESLSDSPTCSRLADAIQASISQAAVIARTILNVAAGESGHSCAPVAGCVEDVVENLLPPDARPRVEVGEINPSLWVATSRHELTQVLLNVILNSIDASRENQGRIRVLIESDSPLARSTRNTRAGRVAIVVSDSGSGADAAMLAEYYRTLSWECGRFVGKNLGTLLCRLIVERAGGDIEVQSQRGRGTIVKVWLPIADYAAPGTSTTSPAATDKVTELPA